MIGDANTFSAIVHIEENGVIRDGVINVTTITEVVEKCFNKLKQYWDNPLNGCELITISDMYEDFQDIVLDVSPEIHKANRFDDLVSDMYAAMYQQFLNITKKIIESIQDIVIFKYSNCDEELNNVDIVILDRYSTLFQVTPYFTPKF